VVLPGLGNHRVFGSFFAEPRKCRVVGLPRWRSNISPSNPRTLFSGPCTRRTSPGCAHVHDAKLDPDAGAPPARFRGILKPVHAGDRDVGEPAVFELHKNPHPKFGPPSFSASQSPIGLWSATSFFPSKFIPRVTYTLLMRLGGRPTTRSASRYTIADLVQHGARHLAFIKSGDTSTL